MFLQETRGRVPKIHFDTCIAPNWRLLSHSRSIFVRLIDWQFDSL